MRQRALASAVRPINPRSDMGNSRGMDPDGPANGSDRLGGIELESEFEHSPVPESHRKSLRTVAAVWFGFPMILTNAVPGGLVVALLGFWPGVTAILCANLVMFGYVGLLSHRAG